MVDCVPSPNSHKTWSSFIDVLVKEIAPVSKSISGVVEVNDAVGPATIQTASATVFVAIQPLAATTVKVRS
jgi:hypothetical protein